MNDEIRIRVQKLLALSESPNPSEAKSAREKAGKLAARHGLTLEEIEYETDIIEKVLLDDPREILYWDNVLLSGILACYAVEALYIPVEEKEKIILVGHSDRIVKVQKQYEYLYDRLLVLGEDYKPVIQDLNSFRLGMAQAVCQALDNMTPRQAPSGGDRDIVLSEVDRSAMEIDDYLKKRYSSLRERDQSESFDPNSLGLGKAVGRKISLLTQLDEVSY